jgi:arylformamidase
LVYSSFDQATLDREYSPSSCIDDIDVYLEEYTRVSRAVKASAHAIGSLVGTLAYGPSEDERLDLFLPSPPRPAGPWPIQIYIHGGYWQALHKEDSLFAAATFQQQGSCFAALDYALAPQAGMTEIVEQIRRAIVWVYTQGHRWGIDPEQIYLSGSSAGAHLASMMLSTDWQAYGLPTDVVRGLCAVSGIYDLEPIRLSYVNEPLGLDHQEAADNSPLGKAVLNACPILLAWGENETGEFKRQSRQFRNFLRRQDLQVQFQEVPGRNHFDVIMDLMDPQSWLSRQVLEQMNLGR